MKKFLVLLLTTFATFTFADNTTLSTETTNTTSSGSHNSDDISNSLYVGGSVGDAWNNVQAPASSFRIDGGYNFNPYLALEIGTTGVIQSGNNPDQGTMQFYDLSIKGTLPIGDIFSLYAQVGGAYLSPGLGLGVGNTNNGSLQSGWDMLTAVGAKLNITQHVSANLTDYYYYGSSSVQGNTNVLLAGMTYNF